MDLWLNPSRSSEAHSKCDFCYQTGVSVKSLSCGSHFYCGVCEKFAPKFYKRSDYTCSRCPGPGRSRGPRLDLDLSPTTLNVRPVKKKQDFKEVTIAVEGGNILTFGDADSDSGDDLEGNNVKWDHLLDSLTAIPQSRDKSPKWSQKSRTESRSVTAVSRGDGKERESIGDGTVSHDDVSIDNKRCSNLKQKIPGQKPKADAGEQERGSSPVKGLRKNLTPYDQYDASLPKQMYRRGREDEEEEGYSPVGDVEGPDFSDSEGHRGGSLSDGYQGDSEDDFW